MNRNTILPGIIAVVVLLGGCAIAPFPVPGLLYTEGKAPYHATNHSSISKTGSACATTILGLVATGDASIAAAMKAGGISEVTAVDYSTMTILGLYGEFCTIASGK